jgi:phosphoribosylformylglycinamidine cyclo-ligase
MCVNDIVVQGAKPLFFLDYLSMGKLDIETATDIIKGIAKGCKEANCALIGGETAEMPDIYNPNEYDLAGFSVGIIDNDKIVDGSEIRVGNELIGIASSGLHSNGYSLARKVCFEKLKLKTDDYIPELGRTIGEELLEPTRIYSEPVLRILKDFPIHGLAHITGGGISDNITRIIPKACKAEINKGSWETPAIFSFLQDAGNISNAEMMKTFNNGIGMIAVVQEKSSQEIMERLQGMNEKVYVIGKIVERNTSKSQIKLV